MAEERPIETPSGRATALTVEEKKLRMAKIAQVLDRGYLNDRLNVPLPDGFVGQWVLDSPAEISRVEGAGYWLDNEYAVKHGIHADGAGRARMGDVVFMITSRENYELIQEVRKMKFDATHNPVKPIEDVQLATNLRDEGLTPDIKSSIKEHKVS